SSPKRRRIAARGPSPRGKRTASRRRPCLTFRRAHEGRPVAFHPLLRSRRLPPNPCGRESPRQRESFLDRNARAARAATPKVTFALEKLGSTRQNERCGTNRDSSGRRASSALPFVEPPGDFSVRGYSVHAFSRGLPAG